MRSPLTKTRLYAVVHVQVPTFCKRHVFAKETLGVKVVPSGTLTSEINWARSQLEADEGVEDETAVGTTGVLVVIAGAVGVMTGPPRYPAKLMHFQNRKQLKPEH